MNTCFCCCAVQRIGEMLVLVEKDDGTPVFIVGPEWHFCVFCTVPMILIVTFLVTYFILVDDDSSNVSLLYYITSKFLTVFQPLWIVPIYLSIAVLTLVSLCLVGCRDPGLLERCTDEEVVENGWFWNEQVGSFRPSHASYCKECKVLVEEYDHVCPWMGSAIGKKNMLAFRFFMVFSNVLCYSSIAIVLYHSLSVSNE